MTDAKRPGRRVGMADREAEAARLQEIEARLFELSRAERAHAVGGLAEHHRILTEVEALLAESKELALDAYTAIFARIAIQAGFLMGRLHHDIRRLEIE